MKYTELLVHSNRQGYIYLLCSFGQEKLGCWCLKTSVLDPFVSLEGDGKSVVLRYLCQLVLTIFRGPSLSVAHTAIKEVTSF